MVKAENASAVID